MHVQIFKVPFLWPYVSLSGKASNALFKHEDSQRLYSVYQAIYSEIELEIVDQVGLMHVPLGNKLIPWFEIDVFKPPCKVNAFALAHIYWLDYERLGFLLVELGFEIVCISWQDPGLWKKVEVIFVVLCKPSKIAG